MNRGLLDRRALGALLSWIRRIRGIHVGERSMCRRTAGLNRGTAGLSIKELRMRPPKTERNAAFIKKMHEEFTPFPGIIGAER